MATFDSGSTVKFVSTADTTAANIFAVQDAATTAKISLKGSGDTVYVEGFAGEYQAKLSGKTLTLKSDAGQVITLNGAGYTVVFLDGALTLDGKKLGTQTLKTSFKAITSELTANSAAETYFAANDGAAASAFTLTAGVDTFVGTSANDVVDATDATITAFDSINGNAGVDTLRVFDITGATADLSLLTVSNLEKLELKSTAGLKSGAADVSTWGLTNATVNLATFAANQAITVGDIAALAVTAKVATTASNLTTTGGSTVNVTLTNAVNNSGKTITVNGGAATTSATVVQTAATATDATAVTVTDKNAGDDAVADTITSVTIDGLTGGVAAVNSDALATLSIANSSQNVTVDNDTADHALAVHINKLTGGVISDVKAKTLTVTATGTASSGITTTADLATAITFAGDKAISTALGATQAENLVITSTNSVGTTITTALDTDVTFNGGAGDDVITIGATTKTINMGAGVNTVTTGTTIGTGGSVNGGSGSTDVLSMAVADAATASASTTAKAAFADKISGFERLTLAAATADAEVKLGNLDSIQYVTVADVAATKTVTLSGVSSGFTLNNNVGTTTDGAISVALATDGTADVLNLGMSNSSAKDLKALTAAGFETINITSDDTATAPAGGFKHVLTALTAAAAKTINISGDAGFTLGYTGTTATLVDASGISKGDFTWTAGALAASSVVKGSATGTNTVTINAATTASTAVTYTGGSGNDVIASTNNNNNVFNLGNGANSINNGGAAGNGNNTVTGGTGVDTVKLGTGNNTINTLGGDDVIIVGSGQNTINAGDGADSITVGAGLSVVTGGAGVDTLVIGAYGANGNTYNTFADATLGTSTTGDKIDLSNVDANADAAIANATLGAKVSLASTASFSDYLNAAAAVNTTDGATVNTKLDKAVVQWFQFGGDTYLVVDNTLATTFASTDAVVKLSGTLDLSASTLSSAVLTLIAV